MTTKKTSDVFAKRASGVPVKEPAALYPRSTPLLAKAFYDIFLSAYAPKTGNSQAPIPPFSDVEGQDDWDLFTLHFRWRERGLYKPALQGAIKRFADVINSGEGLKCYRADDDDGMSFSFTHPDYALKTLHYLISKTTRVSPTTSTTMMRNVFAEEADCGEAFLKSVDDLYSTARQHAKRILTIQEIKPIPMKPYASRADAAAQLSLTQKKIDAGFLLIDLDMIANAVAADCGRALPHPHAAVH